MRQINIKGVLNLYFNKNKKRFKGTYIYVRQCGRFHIPFKLCVTDGTLSENTILFPAAALLRCGSPQASILDHPLFSTPMLQLGEKILHLPFKGVPHLSSKARHRNQPIYNPARISRSR